MHSVRYNSILVFLSIITVHYAIYANDWVDCGFVLVCLHFIITMQLSESIVCLVYSVEYVSKIKYIHFSVDDV